MKVSRVGIVAFIVLISLIGTNCSYYYRVRSRQNLVDGAQAYKNRKFDEAEREFRAAISRDPNGETAEGRTAQVFLARTLHSQFIGNRKQENKAQEAIEEYQKVLENNPNDQSSFKAVANLYENLNRNEEWLQWITARATNESVPPDQRAEAYTSLAAKQYSCANEISDAEPVKKTVVKDGKPAFEFTKPEDPAAYQRLQQCAEQGLQYANTATDLNPNSESAWSYKANLLVQKMRISEMEGNTQLREQYKAEAEAARDRFTQLAEERKQKEADAQARKKAEEEAAAAN
ncbi:MAG TPA: hypothetical protein VK892_03415, partial [Pyrinomonadaceae bacterium]|nr:hypothetical protein [Pyrinomonadaceae bacterium]